jgi:hypothetical protein|eukprot:COSAG06_NODE_8247_length_2224_cov_1.488941_2_plen_59_part_00
MPRSWCRNASNPVPTKCSKLNCRFVIAPFFVGDYFMMPDHVGTRSSDWRRISTRLGTC